MSSEYWNFQRRPDRPQGDADAPDVEVDTAYLDLLESSVPEGDTVAEHIHPLIRRRLQGDV